MSRTRIYLLLALLFLYSCNSRQDNASPAIDPDVNNFCAEKFSVQEAGDYYLVSVHDPWQKSKGNSFTYVLGREPGQLPDSLRALPFIRIPVKRAVIMSTTFIPMFTTLNERSSIVGLSGSKYVYDSIIRERIENKMIADVGHDQGLNYELLVDLKPDVVFMFGVESSVNQVIRKLEDLNVPVVLCADYLEKEALGRAEWIRFFGYFFGKIQQAEEVYRSTASRYDSIREIATQYTEKPTAFIGLPWKDTWYVAGASSFAASFIRDAGGEYLFSDLPSDEALPYDLESVFSRILNADIWINTGDACSLEEILGYDERFARLNAFESGQVYNNNARLGPGGGNDYWESGTLYPDRILEDLFRIFHGSADSLYYYTRLE